MNPATVTALMEGGRFLIETAAQYYRGEISEAEANRRWRDLQPEIEQANDAWEDAGSGGS